MDNNDPITTEDKVHIPVDADQLRIIAKLIGSQPIDYFTTPADVLAAKKLYDTCLLALQEKYGIYDGSR